MRVLGYVRKSQYDAARSTDTDAVARRWLAIEQWAAQRGLTVSRFEDLDVSGKTEAGRPDWARLVGELDAGGVWGVVVEDWRDSHRNVKEFLQFYDDHLAPRGLRIACLSHPNLDPATADGRMLLINLLNINEWEARKSGERRAAANRYKQEILGRHAGPAPFGCARDPKTKHLLPSPAAYYLAPDGSAYASEQPGCEVRYYFDSLHALFTLFSSGQHSLGDAAAALHAAGWRFWQSDHLTPKPFDRFNTYCILKRWHLYAGQLAPYSRPKYGQPRPLIQAGHDPILPVELCEAVAAALEMRHHTRAKYSRIGTFENHRVYLLSGVLFCHDCGQRLSGLRSGDGGRWMYYRHTYLKKTCGQKMVDAAALDSKILDGLKLLVLQTDLIHEVAQEIKIILTLASEDDGTVARLEAQRTTHERLIDLHLAGHITEAEFLKRRDASAAELARLEAETANHPARALVQPGMIEEYLSRITQLEEADPILQKAIVRSFIARIEVHDGEIARLIPQPWAAALFDACKLLNGLDSVQQLHKVDVPAWMVAG